MVAAYLTGEERDLFDAWLAEAVARWRELLTFTEIRRGVQALSELYRGGGSGPDLAARALAGRGKRAALATYWSALHYVTVHHVLLAIGPKRLGSPARVIDVGCGTGATGASAARALGAVRVLGLDRSPWAAEEARRTYAAFRLEGRVRRTTLPAGMPRAGPGVLVAVGWLAAELDEAGRRSLLARLDRCVRAGGRVLVCEPAAARRAPFWREWASRLAGLGVRETSLRVSVERPDFVREMDGAARLDHQVLGASVLWGPPADAG